MKVPHKPLSEQVILITGASSGIGRETAIQFGKQGAKLILVARNAEALEEVTGEVRDAGGDAIAATADVADEAAFKAAAEAGVAKFGRIDTWINNAGVGLYSKILETDIADDRRLFETNFWGLVIGSRLAVPYLKAAGGGALINLGSEVSDVAIPLQGMYATSKHAILGFTDALRDELIADGLPISVTTIKPAAINTPFPKHAKNNTEKDATLPAPVYDVKVVADQILYAAQYGPRELYAGGGGRVMSTLGRQFPNTMDRLSGFFISQQQADRPADHSNEALYGPGRFYAARGTVNRDRHVQKVSIYGILRRHPLTTMAVAAGLVVGAGVAVYALTHQEKESWKDRLAEKLKEQLETRKDQLAGLFS